MPAAAPVERLEIYALVEPKRFWRTRERPVEFDIETKQIDDDHK
jgi:hypothetical protein